MAISLILGACAWAGLAGAYWVGGAERKRGQVVERGDEVELRVISTSPILSKGQPTGKLRYELELDVDGEPTRIYREGRSLLACATNGARVVGLWIPSDTQHLLVIGRDLAPLSLRASEGHEVTMRAARVAESA